MIRRRLFGIVLFGRNREVVVGVALGFFQKSALKASFWLIMRRLVNDDDYWRKNVIARQSNIDGSLRNNEDSRMDLES